MIADMHCHVDLYPDPIVVAREAAQQNIWVLAVTTTPKAWHGTRTRLQTFENIEVALGFHPELVHLRRTEISLFESLLPKSRYVGEVGLDGSPQYQEHYELQLMTFGRILTACKRVGGRVLTIHSRRAATRVIEALEASPGYGVSILHWFTGTRAALDFATCLDCWYSVGPPQLQNSSGIQRVAAMPRNRVLLETDGPFAKHQDHALKPTDVITGLDLLAKVWNAPAADVKAQIEANQAEIWRLGA
ncbi:Qat anti-phage system TatD family nuclease QatD [uncultured Paludibaculum sp.]|uniref:Qat anti-phage system TatD family nuclease QatD n=1 Tax=uncultured Paludibaculum sp. TaxID=1765020 RepID=UPI002AAB5B7C|nr:Qat anti-phage system TatD family nuclease QatD [uncultured Paludibaculum sp.]